MPYGGSALERGVGEVEVGPEGLQHERGERRPPPAPPGRSARRSAPAAGRSPPAAGVLRPLLGELREKGFVQSMAALRRSRPPGRKARRGVHGDNGVTRSTRPSGCRAAAGRRRRTGLDETDPREVGPESYSVAGDHDEILHGRVSADVEVRERARTAATSAPVVVEAAAREEPAPGWRRRGGRGTRPGSRSHPPGT